MSRKTFKRVSHVSRWLSRASKERYTRARRSYRSCGSRPYSLAFHARSGITACRGRRTGMRRVGEESTRGVGIPSESVPCSPRLQAAFLCETFPRRRFGFFLSLEYNELEYMLRVCDFDKRDYARMWGAMKM